MMHPLTGKYGGYMTNQTLSSKLMTELTLISNELDEYKTMLKRSDLNKDEREFYTCMCSMLHEDSKMIHEKLDANKKNKFRFLNEQ
jgi:hypothetical protein